MARKDALLRLHKRLVAKRDALRKKLADDLETSQVASGRSGGDVGDAATDGEQREIDSQLVDLESRELGQIERAIELIREGRYGICEICEQPIPIARLKALPFTPMCVSCQRRQEEHGENGSQFEIDWETAYEHEGQLEDKEYSLNDLDWES